MTFTGLCAAVAAAQALVVTYAEDVEQLAALPAASARMRVELHSLRWLVVGPHNLPYHSSFGLFESCWGCGMSMTQLLAV